MFPSKIEDPVFCGNLKLKEFSFFFLILFICEHLFGISAGSDRVHILGAALPSNFMANISQLCPTCCLHQPCLIGAFLMLDQPVTKSPVYSCSDPVPSLYLTRPASSMPVIACYLHGMSNLAFVTWGPLGTTPHSAAVLFQKLFSVLPSPSPLNSLLSTEGHKKKTQSGGSVVYDPEHVHSDKTKFDPLSQLIRFIILDNLANPLNLSNLTRNGKHCTCLNSRNALIDCKVRGPRACVRRWQLSLITVLDRAWQRVCPHLL